MMHFMDVLYIIRSDSTKIKPIIHDNDLLLYLGGRVSEVCRFGRSVPRLHQQPSPGRLSISARTRREFPGRTRTLKFFSFQVPQYLSGAECGG